MKKIPLILLGIIFLTSIVVAQTYKLEISPTKNIFEAGEPVTIRISLLDAQNNPINDQVEITIEDAEKRIKIKDSVPSNKIISIDIGNTASYGQGTITANYKGEEAKGFFDIKINELVKFDLEEDNLRITNIGNTRYTNTVQITIGETTGIKHPKLNVGESVSYKLVAPEGTYNIKVTDGKTTFTQGGVQLTGTGQVIGALDETAGTRSPVTGGVRPDKDDDIGFLSYVRNSSLIYVFVVVIFGAMILLAIERRYSKKLNKP